MATLQAPTKKTGTPDTLPSEEYVVKAMPSILGPFDMTAIYVSAIFFISNAATAASGGAVAYIYWTLGGLVFFLPCAIATAQLGVMFPHEGSIYNWTHKALGGYWGFLVGLCWWFPGIVVIAGSADIVVTFLQGLNNNWLVAPWQQGLAIFAIVTLSCVIGIQRFRTVQNLINIAVCLNLLAVVLIGTSGVVWLLQGHPSVTSFSHSADWSVNPSNFGLFGLITLAYLGTQVPLNMGGEITGQKVIKRYLLWGTVLVFVGYFVATFSLLVVEGPSNGATPFALVSTVDLVFGKLAGDITAICIICNFIIATVMYNCAFARMLLVGSIDQRLPVGVGKLNKYRVPANAIIFQTIAAIIFTALAFLIAPYVGKLGKPSDLAVEFFNVSFAVVAIMWALITIFFYVNLVRLYRRDRLWFHQRRIFPMWLLWTCIIVGPIGCVVTIIASLLYSWIPQISNTGWLLIVGGLTFACIVFAAIGSILATSEAAWQEMSK
jgi:amino acid transporter